MREQTHSLYIGFPHLYEPYGLIRSTKISTYIVLPLGTKLRSPMFAPVAMLLRDRKIRTD